MFSLEGRIDRRVYSVVVASYLVLMMAMRLITPAVSGEAAYLALDGLFVLASAVLLSMSVRRLHDFGRAGRAVVWTALPLCEAAAIVALTSGRIAADVQTTRPYLLFGATVLFAIWGVAGTVRLMTRNGDEGNNAYGPPFGSEMPGVIVAGGGTLGLVGAKTVAYGGPDAAPAKTIRRGHPEGEQPPREPRI